MPNAGKFFLGSVLLISSLSLQGCGGCGFQCGNDAPASMSLSFSGSSANDVETVVLEVDKITLRRSGLENVEVDTFTIDDLNLTDADTFQIELTDYKASNQLSVIEDLSIDVDDYDDIVLTLIDNDINASYVIDADGETKELNVSGTTLTLDGFSKSRDDQTFIIKFSLLQSLFYVPTSDDYRLTAKGVRVQDAAVAGRISGSVDSELFDLPTDCQSKDLAEKGNRLYLYQGQNLTVGNLADVYTSDSSTTIPSNAIAPYDVILPLENNVINDRWDYAFNALPAGDYTLAFSCNAEVDDPDDFDNISLPLPTDQIFEITLDEAEQAECDLEDGATCQ